MQKSNGSSRIKLNRDAFRLEQGSAAKRRRLCRSECTDPVSDVHAGGSEECLARAEASRSTGYDVRIPVQTNQEGLERSWAPCTLKNCKNNTSNITNTNNNVNNASRRKQIRCHLHVALRFCGDTSARRHAEAKQSVSCTVSRYVNGDVRVQASSSSGEAIEPHAGSAGKSVTNQGVSKSEVKTELIQLGVPEKQDGRSAQLTPSKNRLNNYCCGDYLMMFVIGFSLAHWNKKAAK